jgi:hypothetical protein
LIRDTLLYFPGLNQMWCLVPKVPTQTWFIQWSHAHQMHCIHTLIFTICPQAASTSWSKVIIHNLKTRVGYGHNRTRSSKADDEPEKSVQEILKEDFGRINKNVRSFRCPMLFNGYYW